MVPTIHGVDKGTEIYVPLEQGNWSQLVHVNCGYEILISVLEHCRSGSKTLGSLLS